MSSPLTKPNFSLRYKLPYRLSVISLQVVEISEKLANEGKIVIIAALDGTFQRKPFGRVHELIPIAESVTKLCAVCIVCGDDAAFTQRTIDSEQVELIGGNDIYRPVCRKCFHQAGKSRPTPVTVYSSEKESTGSEESLKEIEELIKETAKESTVVIDTSKSITRAVEECLKKGDKELAAQ